MDCSTTSQSITEAIGMRQLVGQSQRVVASLLGLVWIAQKPQGNGRMGEAGHLWVMQDKSGAPLLGIVENNPFFQVLSGQSKLSKVAQGIPQHHVGLRKGDQVVNVLGQAEELLCQLTGPLELRPYKINHLQPQ